MARIVLALLAAACIGCVSQSSLDGFPLPSEARQAGATFLVLHQPLDERGLHGTIAQALRAHGLNATATDSENATYVVTYVDRWYWDMRTYLIDLRIDVRDAETNVLVSTARSYQTSLAAMGKTQEEIIERTVDVLVEGMEARNQKEQKDLKERRARRK